MARKESDPHYGRTVWYLSNEDSGQTRRCEQFGAVDANELFKTSIGNESCEQKREMYEQA